MAPENRTRPDPIAQVHVDPAAADGDTAAWWIEVSPDATVLELAALMHGLKRKVRARHVGDGVFRITADREHVQPPTGEELMQIMTAGFPYPIPAYVLRPGAA